MILDLVQVEAVPRILDEYAAYQVLSDHADLPALDEASGELPFILFDCLVGLLN